LKSMDYNTGRYSMAAAIAGFFAAGLVFVSTAVFSPFSIDYPRHVVSGELVWEHVAVTAGTTGDVDRVFVRIGDPVRTGDALIRLDAGPSSVSLDDARTRLVTAAEGLGEAKESLEEADDQLDYARGRYNWTRSMYERGAVARMELVRTEGEREFAERLHERALAEYEAAKHEYDEATDSLALMELRFDAAFVTAPADGFVATLSAWEGGSFLRGEEMMTIAVAGEIFVRAFPPPEADVGLGTDVWIVAMTPLPHVYSGYAAGCDPDGAVRFRLRLKATESYRGLFVMAQSVLVVYR